MATAAKKVNQDIDSIFPSPPSDGISSIALNGNLNQATNIAVLTSWDNSVNCYQITPNPATKQYLANPQAQIKHDAPVLCADFSSDNVTVFTGGCDQVLKMWNVTQGTNSQNIGKHDGPINKCKFIPDLNIVVTSSWDKTIRAWDCRQPNPALTLTLSDRIYVMDARGQAMVAGTADKKISVYDIRANKAMHEYNSPLQYQLRSCSIYSDCQGFAVGSIEGRVALEYFNEIGQPTNPNKSSFIYKCHREGNDIFPISAIDFHRMNTFLTAGADGIIYTWDKGSRNRIATFDKFKKTNQISAAKFSPNGEILCYALSYDWSKGSEHFHANNQVLIHVLDPSEYTPRPK